VFYNFFDYILNYLPIQKRLNILSNTASVTSAPVTYPYQEEKTQKTPETPAVTLIQIRQNSGNTKTQRHKEEKKEKQ
jgi:hypothetical protein